MKYYRYSGAGNSFVVFDGRTVNLDSIRNDAAISSLCSSNGTDGLMILSDSDNYDFRMEYYNSDGSGGMMCGNGGRCIVAFAAFLGIRPSDGKEYVFEAADGLHTGEILSGNGSKGVVRIKMIDAFALRSVLGGYFLNTGTRHFVIFKEDVESVDVAGEGTRLRHDSEFAPEGANVNFVQILSDGSLKVRTFEKGVEAETLACGTGITASAIAAWHCRVPAAKKEGERVFYDLHARIDDLSVDFIPAEPAKDVYLTGPAELVSVAELHFK